MTKKPKLTWIPPKRLTWLYNLIYISSLLFSTNVQSEHTHLPGENKKTGKSEKYRPYEKENTKYFQAKIHTFLKCTNYDKH